MGRVSIDQANRFGLLRRALVSEPPLQASDAGYRREEFREAWLDRFARAMETARFGVRVTVFGEMRASVPGRA